MKLIVAGLILLIGLWFTPWSRPRATITVTGQAREQVRNQIARFNVSVTQANKDKDTAVEAVNTEMAGIIEAVKDFGIAGKDITTQNVSVYEIDRPKQWQASNSLEIILRDINQASALTDLLTGFPLAQVSGPSLSVDDTGGAETDLLVNAVEDAREKAEKVAVASKRKLGKVLTINEAGRVYPVYSMEAGLKTAAPVEPGSTEMAKTVTVVFELR